MPLVDKPLIQYVVTEAVEAGIKNIVLWKAYFQKIFNEMLDNAEMLVS